MKMDTFENEIAGRLRSGVIDRYGLIGSNGYTAPDYLNCAVYQFDEIKQGAAQNVVIHGEAYGDNNVVLIHRDANIKSQLKINVTKNTSNAIIYIGKCCTLHGVIALYSSFQTVIITGGVAPVGHNGLFAAQLWNKAQIIYFGDNVTSNGAFIVVGGEEKCVIVGDDCMFSRNVTLQTDDQHAVVDIKSGEWRNPPGDLILEPHVWLGEGVTVSKHVILGFGTVVGTRALVLKSSERFSMLGGVPAKLIRSGVCWDRFSTPSPMRLDKIMKLADFVKPFTLHGNIRSR